MTVSGNDLVSFDITVTAEIAGTVADPPVPITTAVLTAFRASGTSTGGFEMMYPGGSAVVLSLSCTRDDANRNSDDFQYTNMWKIVARNDVPYGAPIFNTTVVLNIVSDHTVRIVVTPAPPQVF